MKRTDFERKMRKLRKTDKKLDVLKRKSTSGSYTKSVGVYIDDLFSLLRYDQEEIFNSDNDENIFELFGRMKEDLPEKQWENVIRKGIKKTGIRQKEQAFNKLKKILDI